MFGMGGTEILVILIVALLFLGPDKLPEAAKKISKGIRDIKKQSRVLQRTIEDDEHIGGAIRDLRSALRGEDEPYRPPPKPARQIEATTPAPDAAAAPSEPPASETPALAEAPPPAIGELPVHDLASFEGAGAPAASAAPPVANGERAAPDEPPRLTLPPTAGESEAAANAPDDAAGLAALVKPAPNTIARGAAPTGASEPSGPKHG